MHRVAGKENAGGDAEIGGDTLADLIDGPPVAVPEFKGVGFQDVLRYVQHGFRGDLGSVEDRVLAVAVQLDVEAVEAVLAGDV